jgi:hypothetical protein
MPALTTLTWASFGFLTGLSADCSHQDVIFSRNRVTKGEG